MVGVGGGAVGVGAAGGLGVADGTDAGGGGDGAGGRAARRDGLRKPRAAGGDAGRGRRERLPDDVRAAVWRRDDGRCVRCGAEQELQFDHVIPFSRGGGNAAENIQILCGPCNRAKGDSIV